MSSPALSDRLRWSLFTVLCIAGVFNAMDRPIIAILKPDMMADFGWSDSDFGDLAAVTQFSDLGEQGRIDAYGIWNASLGFSDSEDKYRVTFHARNITDQSYVLLNVEAGRRLQIPRDADRYFGISVRARVK